MQLRWVGAEQGLVAQGAEGLERGLVHLLTRPGARTLRVELAQTDDVGAVLAWSASRRAELVAFAHCRSRSSRIVLIVLAVLTVSIIPLAHLVGVYDWIPTSLLIIPLLIALVLWIFVRAERGLRPLRQAEALAWLEVALATEGEAVPSPEEPAVIGSPPLAAQSLLVRLVRV